MPLLDAAEADQLPLFDGGPDMAKLRALAQLYRGSAVAPNTKRAYASDWRHFEAWCRAVGRRPLPATVETCSLYVVGQLDEYKVSTVERRVAAIMDVHRRAGERVPSGEMLREVLCGARRAKGSRQEAKAALRAEDLRAICWKLSRVHTEAAVRDRALLTLGFAGGMRRSDLLGLDVGDVQFARKGLLITIRRGKTDQEGKGRVVGVFRGTRATSCPVRALQAWLFLRGREPGPLFVGRKPGSRLHERTLGNIVKRCVELVGLNAKLYGSHSLRAGFVTCAAEGGADTTLIMQRTGHRSVQTVAGYVRPASVFAVDVIAKAL